MLIVVLVGKTAFASADR